MKSGTELIREERVRQIEAEGFNHEHDSQHTDGSLVAAAICYATVNPKMEKRFNPIWADVLYIVPRQWPHSWSPKWWNPSDRIRDLQKAGALIAAEIDRLINLAGGEK